MTKKIAAATLSAALLLSACVTSVTPSQISLVAADTLALVNDIKQATNGTSVTSTNLAIIAAQTATLNADVTALNAGTAGTDVSTVLSDVTEALDVVGPILPDILPLIALAAPAPAANGATISPLTVRAMNDFAKLKADIRAATAASGTHA